MGSLEASDAEAAAVAKTVNRVTLDHIKSLVIDQEYYNPEHTPQLTICCLKLKNGFTLVGESACADPANFNEELGRKFAFKDALKKVWAFEAYALLERGLV